MTSLERPEGGRQRKKASPKYVTAIIMPAVKSWNQVRPGRKLIFNK
jgi:hypothetical protein